MVNAIVAIEDHRSSITVELTPFGSSALSLIIFLRGRMGFIGGSTLTQQLIKLTYFSTSKADQTVSRKAQEAWLAFQLERTATKQQILTYYVNKVYMSNGNYGMVPRHKVFMVRT